MAVENESDRDEAPTGRRFRFSIRAVLVLITILAVWFGVRANIARQEARATELVREHGCNPHYSHDISGNLPSFAPRRVREAMGEEYFGRVVRLNFATGMPASDEAFSMLDHLPGVTVINTKCSGIGDDGFRSIAHLSQLTTLRLPMANITDEGLKHLRGLSKLNLLDLGCNNITDKGISHLSELPNLELLTLKGTDVTDEGIKQLGSLPRLKYLNVQSTQVTEAGAESLNKKLPQCEIHFGR